MFRLGDEPVRFKTREGNLVILSESPPERNLLDSMRGTFIETKADLTRHYHFGTLEAEFFRQPDRLTATIGEELCRIHGGSICL